MVLLAHDISHFPQVAEVVAEEHAREVGEPVLVSVRRLEVPPARKHTLELLVFGSAIVDRTQAG